MNRPRTRGRLAGGAEDNPWQRATALAARLRVTVADAGARWTHPTLPATYTLHPDGSWSLVLQDRGASIGWRVLASGRMDEDAARVHLERARAADPRRLAAAVMLRHLPPATLAAEVAAGLHDTPHP